MRSFSGGRGNKLVTNNLMEEMRTIWHHLFLNLPKREGAGGAGTTASQGRNTSRKAQKSAAAARARTETRQPAAGMPANRASASLGPRQGANWRWLPAGECVPPGVALKRPLPWFLPPPVHSRPTQRGASGDIHMGLAAVCRDTGRANAPFTLLLQGETTWRHPFGLALVCPNPDVCHTRVRVHL